MQSVEDVTLYLKSHIYAYKTAFPENKHYFHDVQLHRG